MMKHVSPSGALKLLRAAGLSAVLGGLSATSASAVTIDHFNVPAGGQIVSIVGGIAGSTASSTALGLVGVLGGSRTIEAEVQAIFGGGNSTEASANDPATALDNFNLATDVNVNSIGRIRWDAAGAGLNHDFSGGSGSFALVDVSNDLPTTYTLVVETFGGGSSISTQVTGGATFGLALAFPTASFVGGADWTDIDRITLIVDTPRSGDARIHTLDFNVVDGGSACLLLGSALTGMALMNRKKLALIG